MEWVDPDLRVANGIAISDQGDMLRLDAMLMTVQLNLRKMLQVRQPSQMVSSPVSLRQRST